MLNPQDNIQVKSIWMFEITNNKVTDKLVLHKNKKRKIKNMITQNMDLLLNLGKSHLTNPSNIMEDKVMMYQYLLIMISLKLTLGLTYSHFQKKKGILDIPSKLKMTDKCKALNIF